MRKALLVLATFLMAVTIAATPVGAGTSMPMFTIDPTSGEAGTVATFESQTPCPLQSTDGAVVNAPGDNLAAISRVAQPSIGDYLADTVVDPSTGDWSLTYTIPGNEPVGEITFYAFCLYEDFPPATVLAVPVDSFITARYEPEIFTVTLPPTTTTTSTTTTAPSTTTTVPAPSLVASPVDVVQGGTIAVQASGFEPGSNVVITLESDPVNLGTFVADSAGRIATNIVVPADFPTGPHTLKLTGTDIAGAVLVLSTGITVASRIQVVPTSATTAAPVAASQGTLPQTGSSATEPALLAGAGLVLLGSVALLAARRRRATSASR